MKELIIEAKRENLTEVQAFVDEQLEEVVVRWRLRYRST